MPDLLTPQVLAAAGPLLLDTFFKHFLSPGPTGDKDKDKAREDLMYDEAFVLMKTFLEMATKHPCAALQRFGQAHTPSPPWVAVHRLEVPSLSLHSAADFLITALGGPEMAYKIAGGTKWWQVRAGQGVEAEWIAMKKDWRVVVAEGKKERRNEKKGGLEGAEDHVDDDFTPEMDRLRCMLYIHGGAYYWGSINTHRYTIWRHARKMHGRCFAVNYRKAPQYPFPCAIQDCLAAYLYLINPPPDAPHRPVDPKSIVIAGDSAGGGLCLALLQILRDTPGLELPAGAVLISPWSDLTHSFPSILENTATDVVPPYGFIHKPSSLWPPPPPVLTEAVQSKLRSRMKDAVARVRANQSMQDNMSESAKSRRGTVLTKISSRKSHHNPPCEAEDQGLEVTGDKSPDQIRASSPAAKTSPGPATPSALQPTSSNPLDPQAHPPPHKSIPNPSLANPAVLFEDLVQPSPGETRPTTLAQCETPLSLMVKGDKVVLDTQIQLYATNAQLCHPWVSPVLGYLGGLPPLYIMCGDNEVLRDEIVYLAHKAANPQDHPIRNDVRVLLPSLHNIESRHPPTNVHLQIYDGVCHDLPLFSMAKPARGCFRAIATFVRYVTPSAPGSLYIRKRPGTGGSQSQQNPTEENFSASGGDKTTGEKVTASPKMFTPRNSKEQVPTLKALSILVKKRQASVASSSVVSLASSLTGTPPQSPTYELVAEPSWVSGAAAGDDSSDDKAMERGLLPPPRGKSLHEHYTPQSSQMMPSASGNSDVFVPGENVGPRFPLGEGDDGAESVDGTEGGGEGKKEKEGVPGLDDSRAEKGEAGWPGIYRGDKPFQNHMIRERVSPLGIIRPLSPPASLSALQMPAEEIGKLKEGPALRYINGQALWNKKYKRAGKKVNQKRERNLKDAKGTSEHVLGSKMERVVREAMEAETGEKESSDVAPNEDISAAVKKARGEKNADMGLSWTWALHGESPPASAIVSRRDFGEARQLALMADRADSSSHVPFHGLNVWIALTGLFSSTSEKEKIKEMLQEVKEEQHKGNTSGGAKEDKKEVADEEAVLDGEANGKVLEGKKKKGWRFWKNTQ